MTSCEAQHASWQPAGVLVLPGSQITEHDLFELLVPSVHASTQLVVSLVLPVQMFIQLAGSMGPKLPSGQVVAMFSCGAGVGRDVGSSSTLLFIHLGHGKMGESSDWLLVSVIV
jgi:hypothetical protein